MMPSEYVFNVPFRDMDMHGHVHNSAYICYFEAAIAFWIEQQELTSYFNPVFDPLSESLENNRFFVKKIETVFHQPTQYNCTCHITTNIAKLGKTSIGFDCHMFLSKTDRICAQANIVWVCVDKHNKPKIMSDILRSALVQYKS